MDIPVLRLRTKHGDSYDALYGARCRLICHVETNPENFFFFLMSHTTESTSNVDQDLMRIETVAEVQDVYRPNVSMHNAPSMSEACYLFW